jgi:FtsZ-interacting cell division protein YlmF
MGGVGATELPRIGTFHMGVLDDIKNKLGFAGDQRDDQYDDGYYDEAGYDDDFGDGGGYGQDYDDSYGDYGSSSRRSGYSSTHNEGSGPRLVSIDDVRARTQIPESLNRDPLPARQPSSVQSAYAPTSAPRSFQSGTFRKVERASDYMRSTDTSDIAPQHTRSSGYDAALDSTSSFTSSSASVSGPPARSYDPYDAYSGAGVTSHNPSRSLTVLKPISYAEVEKIAKSLKAGDVVVLGLVNTQDHLAKRILDFAFGVSSALDASVECIADKVFVVNRGRALSEEEMREVRMKV